MKPVEPGSPPISHCLLVVDDTPTNLIVMQALLGEDYELVCAVDGPDCLNKAESILPDAILLDVMMPNMDGYEVCRILKRNAQTRHIPIFMLSGLNEETMRRQAILSGATACLEKPINKAKLNELLNKALH